MSSGLCWQRDGAQCRNCAVRLQILEAPQAEKIRQQESDCPELDAFQAQALILEYYATRGEWAGIYIIDAILDLHLAYTSPGKITACVHYHYQAINSLWQTLGDYERGTDRRYFIIECIFRRWIVRDMGGDRSC